MGRRRYSELSKEEQARVLERKRKWKLEHPKSVNDYRRKQYQKTAYAPNHKKPWDEINDDLEVVTSPLSDSELSKKLGRSVQAIQIRRTKLKKEGIES